MYATLAPWIVTSMFLLIALWSAWAVAAAVQGYRRRRSRREPSRTPGSQQLLQP